MLLVFNLSLGKSRAAVDAPMHGLLALVDHPLLDEAAQSTDDRGLVGGFQRQIRVVPQPQPAQPLELRAHHVHVLQRVSGARTAKISDAHRPLLRAELAIDAQLDRQAVAIPAGDVWRVETGHAAALDDEILEDLVQSGPDVDVTVGVRRAVVEDESRRAAASFTQLTVEVDGVPAGNRFRLSRLQVRLHRKNGPREIDRVLPLGHKWFILPRSPAL